MGCDINFTAPSNQLNFKRLFGYIWYLYSNMSNFVLTIDWFLLRSATTLGFETPLKIIHSIGNITDIWGMPSQKLKILQSSYIFVISRSFHI